MSDYFAALMRSAGSDPGVGLDRPQAADDGGDLIEQHVDRDAASVGERPVAPATPFEASAAPRRDPGAHRMASGPDTELEAPSRNAPPQTRDTAPAPKALAHQAAGGDVHPAVHAALRWVAADPQTQPSEGTPAPRVPPLTPARHDRTAPHHSRPASATRREHGFDEAESGPAHALREVPTVEPKRVINHSLAPTPGAEPGFLEVPVLQRAPREDRVEVSIGAIHVRVDAPVPRTVMQPAPAPQRTAAVRGAERNGLSRSRLPRF